MKMVKRYNLAGIKQLSPEDAMYTRVTIFNNIALYLKVAKRVDLKSSHKKKRKKNSEPCVVMHSK